MAALTGVAGAEERRLMTDAVVIESIEIRRAPGIVDPFALPDFGGGVNVVTGPNASGKSTTARLLHQLFWKHDGRSDAHLIVRFRMGDDVWMLRRDGRLLTCHCNGDVRSLPPFDELSDDTRDRYLLALHDLLSAGDAAFARTIAREMAGGFDLDAAAKALGYQAKPSAPQTLKQDLDRAVAARRQATNQQEALFSRESELDRLRHEASRANKARADVVLLDQIGRALEASQALAHARSQFALFPEALGRFRGDELEVANALEAGAEQLQRQRGQAEQELGLAEARLSELHLPEASELDRVIATMSAYLKALDTTEQAASAERINQQTASERSERVLRGISGVTDPEQFDEQAIALFDEMAAALEKLNRAESDEAAMQAIAAWIGSTEPPAELDRINAGVRELQQWLRAPDPAAAAGSARLLSEIGLIAAVALTIEAIVLGLRVHPALFALLLVPVALVAWLYSRRSPAHDPRVDVEQRFSRLGIAQPEQWRTEDVDAMLDRLQSAASAGMVDLEKAQRWADLARKRAEAERLRDAALAEAEGLEQRLGIDRALSVESVKLVRQALYDAIDAAGDARSASARLAAIELERQRTLAAFNEQGARIELVPAGDAAQAAALLQQAQHQASDAADANRKREQARIAINDQIAPALTENDAQREALLARIGLERIDEIAPLAVDLDVWRAARKRLDDAILTLDDRRSPLPDVQLDEWSVERVERERQEQAFLASQYETLMNQISTIEAESRQAKQGRGVEQALAAEADARSSLKVRRDDDVARVIGALVVETARQQSDEASMPEVARNARRLFARITRGRYELRFDPGEPPSFRALDTVSGIAHPLEELSSGTRVQLLLAVRAAFVETNERSARLPLLLDETLANADESRAEAMIEAAFDLAAEGRQLFYFTAQRDEVEKWRAIGAGRPETTLTVIDLAAARHIPSQIRTDRLELPRMERVRPPAPDGMSREDYRGLIGVMPLGIWSQGDGDIHLWYLASDLVSLYRMLADDVSTWGQLKSYIDQGAAGQFGLGADELARISARAKLCGAIRRGARVGRGTPANAAVLDASGAISASFNERCVVLLDECTGDAEEFVARLRAKAIGGFRADKIDQLEQFFRDNGHIVDSEPLKPDELAHWVRIELTAEFVNGAITRDDLHQMMVDLAMPGIGISRTALPDQSAAAPALPVP